MLGKVLHGRYQVFQTLRNGGFGHTYLAKDLHRPGQPQCVVKHLKPNTDNPKFLDTARRLFNSEAEILEQLGRHDQIPQLLAYFEEDQELFLVQELIQGQSLDAELQSGERWTEDRVIQFLRQVLEILEFIHRYKVIHRDINPSNIIRRQQDGKLVLIDFGAVKQIQSPQGPAERTVIIGTIGYMSREQSIGQPVPSSDIYALGVIGIQALSGLHPSQMDRNPQTGEIIWQHQVQISPNLAAVLSKMVLFDFRKRYSSAADVLSALVFSTQGQDDFCQDPEDRLAFHTIPPFCDDFCSDPVNVAPPPRSVQDSPLSPSRLSLVSFLDPERYSRLEKMLVELIGPVAPTLLRQTTATSLSCETLIEDLSIYLTPSQQIEFKRNVMRLWKEPTRQSSQTARLPDSNPLDCNELFIRRCEEDLADLVGPIASFIVQRAVKTYPQISRLEFVKVVSAEISSDPQIEEFQQRVLS
ncbi:MAG: serine/threonine protein kinase [Myxacorys chilensis ATA2-1-KO14]|jgi:serine/threonine-protein kinase|nr:serine/threonine protein kinase [Myxacorys chilensis ATA2-1-KO14]